MNLKLKHARLSYPALFDPKTGPKGGEPKYSAAFLVPKHSEAHKQLLDGILAVAKSKWGDKSKWHNGLIAFPKADGKAATVQVCLRDGSDKPDTDGYGDEVVFFNAGSKDSIPVRDRNPSIALTKESGRPYAGCYVNVAVRLWAQDNQFGRRINAALQAVQFADDGEPFGESKINPESAFENLSGEAASPFSTEGKDEIPF